MSAEGKIGIRLSVSKDAVEQVSVNSMRPLHLPEVLKGRDAQQAIDTVSLLYRICSEAQTLASVQAIESALGMMPDPEKQWVRRQLLNMEIVREHVWRILLDWPMAIGRQPDRQSMAAMMSMAGRWRQCIDPEGRAYAIQAGFAGADLRPSEAVRSEFTALLETEVFSRPLQAWLELDSAEAFLAWANDGDSDAARFFQWLVDEGWAERGKTEIAGLPELDEPAIERLLLDERADRFIAEPSLEGVAYETTPFARHRDSPLIAALCGRFGHGLLARFASVLLEVAEVAVAMRDSLKDALSTAVSRGRRGIGVVEAARGRLIHRVELTDDRVERYQIVAPTEWNFHPQGALVEGLKTLDASNRQSLEKQAHLMVYAMDPCVGYALEVEGYA